MMQDFHFLRPLWFLALIPLVVGLALWWRRGRSGRDWAGVVDARLLPYVLIGTAAQRSRRALVAVVAAGLLALTALAGPTWSKLKQPVFRRDSALVVLLDLSRSMEATDLKPNRLQMARFKLRDLLDRRKEGDTALVVYAAEPYTVTPLTGDVATIERQLGSLTPELMPAQGSRADLAIAKAEALMQGAGAVRGDVLLITDGVENTAPDTLDAATRRLVAAGYRLSVLGVGTPAGAPIPVSGGGFLTDKGGAIVIPRLDGDRLSRLAALGHGTYRHLEVGDGDVAALTAVFDRDWPGEAARKVAGLKSDQWREAGPWLLLPLLPIAALAFRRGVLVSVCLLFLLPVPRPAQALEWRDFWQRPDQQAAAAMAAHKPKEAARLFRDPRWRAAAQYRAGDYRAALKDLTGQPGAEAAYNRGNALAHLGKYPEALKAYEAALKQDPKLEDAAHNRDLVRKWLRAHQSGSGKDGKPGDHAQKGKGATGQDGASDKNRQGQKASSGGTGRQAGRSGQAHKADQGRSGARSPESSANRNASDKGPSGQDRAGADDARQAAEHGARQAASNSRKARDGKPGAQADRTPNESEQATAQWLRRIPDDPGGLWRRKFLYQYKREHPSGQQEAKPW